jgi:transposase
MIVIGVDPHKRSHTAAVVAASTGGLLGSKTVAARGHGHGELLLWARSLVASRCSRQAAGRVSS